MAEDIKTKLLLEINKLKAPEGYLRAGFPNYFALFGRDSLVSAWQMLEIDPTIARSTLQILAKYQGKVVGDKSEEEPGKILHEHRLGSENQLISPQLTFPYFGGVDTTPLFAIVAEKYFEQTHDEEFIKTIWDNITNALNWLSAYGDPDRDNFIEYKRRNPYGLFHQGWRDSSEDHLHITPPVAIVEVQGYAYAAYMAGVELAKRFGTDDTLRNSWKDRADALKNAFQKAFWWEEKQFYYLALDNNKSPKRSLSSNVGHLLFTGLVSDDAKHKLVKRLFQPDMITPFGIRTVSTTNPRFNPLSYHFGSIWPHDNWIIYYGLKLSRFSNEAEQIKQGMLSAYYKLGYIPELFGVKDGEVLSLSGGAKQYETGQEPNIKANSLQAWAVCGLLNMIWKD